MQDLVLRRAAIETGLPRWRLLLEAARSLPSESPSRNRLVETVLGELSGPIDAAAAGVLARETSDLPLRRDCSCGRQRSCPTRRLPARCSPSWPRWIGFRRSAWPGPVPCGMAKERPGARSHSWRTSCAQDGSRARRISWNWSEPIGPRGVRPTPVAQRRPSLLLRPSRSRAKSELCHEKVARCFRTGWGCFRDVRPRPALVE